MRVDLPMLKRAVPNAFTLGNGLCGVAGLIVMSGYGSERAPTAAALIFVGWVFDMIDGIAARRLGTAGAFGAALDAICDAITFGALPAVLISAGHAGAFGIVCAFAFTCGALVRLARYVAQAPPHDGPRWYFEGLPSPAAAMMIATAVLLHLPAWQSRGLAVVAALAMVSRLPYADLPRFFLTKRWPWPTLLVPVLAGVVLGAGPIVAAILLLYLLSGLAMHLVRLRKPVAERA